MQVRMHLDVGFFLDDLERETRGKVYRVIDLLRRFENRLRMPYSESLSAGLFELRIKGRLEVRILYVFKNDEAFLLNAFIKKTNKTPRAEIERALRNRDLD